MAFSVTSQWNRARLAALSLLATAADRFAYTTGVGQWAEAVVTAFGRSLLDDADAGAARATLGLGTAATEADTKYAHRVNNLSDLADAATACAALGTWHVLGRSAVAVSHTGDTNMTTLATVTVPGGSMGPNGILRITTLWSYTNSSNNKTIRTLFGGVAFQSGIRTTTATLRDQRQIANRNAENAQVGGVTAVAVSFGSSAGAVTTAAIDTTVDQNVEFRCQLADAGETITLEYYLVELLYGA